MKQVSLKDFFDANSLSGSDFPFFYSEKFEEFQICSENKKIVLVSDINLNSIICKKWKNKFLTLLQPMYPPLTKEGIRLSVNEEKTFLNKFISFVRNNKLAHRITQPENFAVFSSTPDDSTGVSFGTYYIDLKNNTEEQLFENLHSKHRNVIRNAEKKNVILKYGKEVLGDFYDLYKETMSRSNMYCQSKEYFKEFYTYLPENTICGVAYYNQKPQGALFMPYTKFSSFYLYGATAEKIEVNGCMNYLHWNTLKLLKEKGVKRYDFVGARLSDISGTKLAGIQQFKERFGALIEKGFIWKKDLNILQCSLFDNLVGLKLRLKNQVPPKDIIDQERKKIYG